MMSKLGTVTAAAMTAGESVPALQTGNKKDSQILMKQSLIAHLNFLRKEMKHQQ
jgi:hypothetical protein